MTGFGHTSSPAHEPRHSVSPLFTCGTLTCSARFRFWTPAGLLLDSRVQFLDLGLELQVQHLQLTQTALMVRLRTTGATSRAAVTMPGVQVPCAPGSILSVTDHVILPPLLD